MALTDIVRVAISILRALIAAAGFGVPLIVGSSTRISPDRYRSYSGEILTAMIADGWLSSDAEYLAASAMLAGAIVPSRILVGRRLTPVAQTQVLTLPADPTDSVTYSITINGVVITTAALDGTSTTAELQAALVTAINGSSQAPFVTAANSGPDVIVTSDLAGTAFTISLGTQPAAPMVLGAAVANHGVQEDMDDIRAAGASWYATMQTSRVATDIRLLAAWTQSHTSPPTIFVAQSSEATSGSAAVSSVGTDIANITRTAGYTRTFGIWKALDSEYADAAWLGRELPVDPGSDNWALKELVGITPDILSSTYRDHLVGAEPGTGKNWNVYIPLTEQNNITFRGTMVSGDWIDSIRFVDFLTARISESVGNLLLSKERLQFDEPGLEEIRAAIAGPLQAAKDARKLQSFTITVPPISAYSSTVRTARTLDPPITFVAIGAGALNDIRVSGSVTE